MRSAFTGKFSILAAVALGLCLPAIAAAQWGRYPDDRGYGRYDGRDVRDSVHRLDSLAKTFERDIDRALDRSRVNGSDREDRINAEAHNFRRAVGDLKSRVGNGRDLNRSTDEARRVLQQAERLDRFARPGWFNGSLSSEWSQIQSELRFISDVYGFRYNGDYRGGRSGDYRRDRDYRRTNPIDDLWRRIPFPR
jgi:hypothetical protein